MVSAFIFLKNPFLPNISHINLVKCAAMYARIVYTITKIKNDASKIAKATIKYIAKNVAATSIGHLSIF